jgi:glutamate synthase domain-containing protein 2/glutamate synthase domain-containing protein 1/glutamate synthase domain-containing protein 3
VAERRDETEHDACGVGFLADLTTRASHDVVAYALEAVARMAHRGARAADGKTGDGAGVMLDTPRALLWRDLTANGIHVDQAGIAAVGVFLPLAQARATALRFAIEQASRSVGLQPLRWRTPPVDTDALGDHARQTQPQYQQLIVDMGRGDRAVRAHRMRRAYEAVGKALASFDDPVAALVSASAGSIVYKALLSSDDLAGYYGDLRDPLCESRFALFHQRFSTNTSPSWRLVQPFRHIAHNGEFNTIEGNRTWLRARGIEVGKGGSDSHDFNIAVDAMLDGGYTIGDSVDLLLGAAVEPDDGRLQAYYDAHLPTVEHWDGPAAIVFYHQGLLGAALDRSGFRPLRWCKTASGKILAASEAGVVDFVDDPIVERGRLGPGERILVDIENGEVTSPAAFRAERRERADFRATVRAWRFDPPAEPAYAETASLADLRRFAYHAEDVKDLVAVMASGAGEPVSSMGDDAAVAFLQGREPAHNYLRQRFAQVTNPPIDPLREALVFDMRSFVGCGGVHGEVASPLSAVVLESAIQDEASFDALCDDERLVRHDIALVLGSGTLDARIEAIAEEAVASVRGGATLIVLDNRGHGPAVAGLLAAGAVHQRLVAVGLRMQSSIVVADGFARDAHSIAATLAAGANVVSPWLALRVARERGATTDYLYAVRSGLMKILAKLGICTLRSYIGAQTFETLGLAREVVERCFPAMRAHLPAIGFEVLESDARAWFEASSSEKALGDHGSYRFRRDGVRRAFAPNVIKVLRASALRGDYTAYEELSDAIEAREPVAVRDLLDVRALGAPLALDDVAGEREIAGTFAAAAMSLGALGPEAHAAVSEAANLAGAIANSGEGGIESEQYDRAHPAHTRIKQIASARFGVTAAYLASADEIEIKMAQGSKPGEGGQIPGSKVSVEIARLRGASPGQSLISPPPHHDIYSIEDLAQLIYDLRRVAPRARIAVKLVAQSGIGTVASGVAKAGADVIHISGHDGGTGASPLGSIKHAGLPWELGLAEVHDTLVANGLRDRVMLRTDGGLKTGRDVIVGSILGADRFTFGSALLVALGCIYARQCHKNTCPVGIATQDETLRKKFVASGEQGASFFTFVARDVRRRLAKLGARSLAEIRGRRDLLQARESDNPLFANVDLSELLALATSSDVASRPLDPAPPHIDERDVVGGSARIAPEDRAVGSRHAYEHVLARARGDRPAPLDLSYYGTAGQSFGAFLTHGISLHLDGDANDYVGKGMDGGRIVVLGNGDPSQPAVGNTCFYGARGGEAFIGGTAGERFAVRNSGAHLVVEGAGDHACEYMTAGAVAILGPVGRNLASGMSGGVAFVLQDDERELRMGPLSVAVSALHADDPDAGLLQELLRAHLAQTSSARARALLEDWPHAIGQFRKLAPEVAAAIPA